MSDAVVQPLLEALGQEIEAIRRRGGSTQVEVRGGEQVGRAEGQFLYQFHLAQDAPARALRDDSPVRAHVGAEQVDGAIVSLADGIVVIALDRDLGPRIPSARITADDSFLLEKLKERLQSLGDGEKFNHRMATSVMSGQVTKSKEANVDGELLLGQGRLNEEQITAIRRAIGSDITYIWGPPGTGKTTVVARIVEGLYKEGKTVLVVSNTNIAVDTALERVAERLQHDAGFQGGAILRYGLILKGDLKDKYGKAVDIEAVVEEKSRALVAEKKTLEQQLTTVQAKAQPLQELLGEIERLDRAMEDLDHARETVRSKTAKERQDRIALDATVDRLQALKRDLRRARTMGGIRRLLSGLNPEKLNTEIGRVSGDVAARTDALTALSEDIRGARRELEAVSRRVEELRRRLTGKPSRDQCLAELRPLEEEMEEVQARLRDIAAQLAAVRDEVLAGCKVMATTVYRTYLKGQVSRTFDAVVIDEASMLPLPMSYYAAGLAKEKVVVAGDFRQLPAIAVSDQPAVMDWFKPDVFSKAGIPDAVGEGRYPDCMVVLREQYRMRPEICGLISDVFYEKEGLRSAGTDHVKSDTFPWGDAALYFVDTARRRPWNARPIGSFSRYNVLHALAIRNLVLHLAPHVFPADGSSSGSLGALAPFNAQVRLLQDLLAERLAKPTTEIVSGVHRFQGSERDTVIVDLTDSFGLRASGFLRARSLDEDGARLLNVALSRARKHIILVANFEFLESKLPADAVVREVLNYFEREGERLDIDEVLSLGPEDWLEALEPVQPPKIDFDPETAGSFTEATFYPAFIEDLKSARESIVIFSPFVTGNGAGRWMDLLRMKLEDGVNVRVVCRPPETSSGGIGDASVISDIEETGITVDMRAGMHEKFAIVDSAILWHGSLNILSHRDSSESMLRIPSRSACRQLARFVTSRRRGSEEADEVGDLSERENPRCDECNGLMVWRTGRYGIYFECFECRARMNLGGSRGARGRSPVRREHAAQARKNCPRCGSPLRHRTGRYGPFWGCTAYPKCRYTQDAG